MKPLRICFEEILYLSVMSQAEVYTKYCRKWYNQGRMVKCNIQKYDRTISNQINATGIKYVMLEK